MATTTHISLTEYLETDYRPDREYIDGELRERNVGKYEHARVQALLAMWFGKHEAEWDVVCVVEQRLQTSADAVRVPDVAIMIAGPQPDVVVDPPLLVIEILSPKDSYSDTQERAQDYARMGVETIWIVDPRTRTGRMCVGDRWIQANRLTAAGTPLFVELDAIFDQIQVQPRT